MPPEVGSGVPPEVGSVAPPARTSPSLGAADLDGGEKSTWAVSLKRLRRISLSIGRMPFRIEL